MEDIDKIVKKYKLYNTIKSYLYIVGIYIGMPYLLINIANQIGGWLIGVIVGIIYFVIIYILHRRILELSQKIFELSKNPQTAKKLLNEMQKSPFTKY